MNNISRRDALRVSGLSVFGAAFLAACGKQSGVPESANILSEGIVPPTTALPEGVITDVVLLRTAASLEYNAIDTYNAVLEGGLLTGDFAKLTDAVKRFRDDHQAHADAVNGLVVALGGKAHTCANARIDTLYIQPALALITAKDNPELSKDVVALAHALENLATQTSPQPPNTFVKIFSSQMVLGLARCDQKRHALLGWAWWQRSVDQHGLRCALQCRQARLGLV
jgi:hypothetical protein